MSSVTLSRTSGLALLLGAVLAGICSILSAVIPYLTPVWVVTTLLWNGGLVLLLLGLPGIVVRQAARAGWLGFIGFLLTFLGGWLLASSVAVGNLTISPWLAVYAPQVGTQAFSSPAVVVYNNVELVLLVLGEVLLGIATIRAKVFPRWAGWLLVVGGVLASVSSVGFIASAVSSILLVVGLGWMGYKLWIGQGAAVPQPALAL